MRARILIKTPKGQAKGTEKRLRPFLLGRHKPIDLFTNDDNNEIVWVVECNPRTYNRIMKNVALYDVIIKNMFDNRLMKKAVDKYASRDAQVELKDMLMDQTDVSVIKEATAEELIDDKPWYNKIKERLFRR